MIDYLTLITGADIPFIEATLIVHQPRIKQIAYFGENKVFTNFDFLNFSKKKIENQDKSQLQNIDDFDILMEIIKSKLMEEKKQELKSVLGLLFPQYQIAFLPTSIMIFNGDERHLIDKSNFIVFKEIINAIFCMHNFSDSSSKYNPGGAQARALVQKFRKRQEKLRKIKNQGKTKEISILARYISILAVGESKDINSFLDYTIYQLFDEFQRFKLYQDNDIYVKCKLAGAKDLQEIKNWMSDLTQMDD